MAAPNMTRRQADEALALLAQHGGNVTEAAKADGVSRTTMSSRVARARNVLNQPAQTEAAPVDSLTVSGDAATISRLTTERIKSLADLIRVCDIDTNEWEIERYVCNKWEVGAKVDEKMVTTPLFQVKAWMKRKVMIVAARAEIVSLIEDAKRELPARPRVGTKAPKSGNLFEPSIPDLHVGKLAWAKETGWENYDGKIAQRIFEEALSALIHRTESFQPERILFPIGNDILHADTKAGTTTAGTPLDMDSRYHKSFSLVRRMMTQAIDSLRAIAPVHVVIVPGNHDTLSAWHLGDSLECFFHKSPDVTIDNAPSMRKYYQWGKVMLMLTHGNKGKLQDYPQVMAAEQRKMWGETIHREAHTGDKHQLRVQEYHGVRVRISPALCPPDAWHSEHLFVGNARAAEAFVFHREEGLIGMANYTVQPPKRSEAA